MQHAQLGTAGAEHVAVGERAVGIAIGIHDVPQHEVGGVQQDRRVDRVLQRDRGVDVIVVAVGQRDRGDVTAVDRVDDRLRVVGGIDDDDLPLVADEPDVVGDLPLAAVESEDARRVDEFDRGVLMKLISTTTLRSTSPRSIRWNASSTSPRPMVSVTKSSSGRRPCRWRSTSSGKSRLGRQSPYQLGLSAPPRPKKSIIGMSGNVIVGVGTPTCTTVPARSRA